MFFLAFSLALEKNSINWLKNRNGCNYKKLQKCCEIDMREQAIKSNWPKDRPIYDPESYRHHYLRHDFDNLKNKFFETDEESMKRSRDDDENR